MKSSQDATKGVVSEHGGPAEDDEQDEQEEYHQPPHVD